MIIIRPLPCGEGIAAHEEACDDAGNVLGITSVYAPSDVHVPSMPVDVPFVPHATITHFVSAVWMTKGDRLRSLVITIPEAITYMDTAVTTP